jgi:superfamily II DNA or RNA helicase
VHLLREPTRLYLDPLVDAEQARRFLTYRDTSVEFELRKLKKNHWLATKDPEEWQARVQELEAQRQKCLLSQDEQGNYTHSGLKLDIENRFGGETINEVVYPDARLLPWSTTPPDLRPYQDKAKALLLGSRHAAVNMGTGLGKSFIIMHICRTLGLKAVVMAPLTSIAEQLYDDFCRYLGPKWVGFYGDGKKHTNKLITIAIGASLARVEKGSKDFAALSQAKVFIADESHQTPASTLTRVCLDLLKDAPYRFFFSGTQTRTDGAEMLLKGIIGPIVFQMSVRDGVDQGYLAKPVFKFYRVTSDSPCLDGDPNKMTRQHLFYNPRVNAMAGAISNGAIKHLDHSVLILIDEMEQFAKLLPHMKYEVGFAHGGVTKDNRNKIPSQFHQSNPKALVKAFNDRKLRILIGTSCIATGTDIRAVKTLIYLRGGKSEIELGQGLGRGTRLFKDGAYEKTTFNYVDFDVTNVESVHRHAQARADMCDEIYGPVKFIDT